MALRAIATESRRLARASHDATRAALLKMAEGYEAEARALDGGATAPVSFPHRR